MACRVHDSIFYKILTIACYDMQYEDNATQTLFWGKY